MSDDVIIRPAQTSVDYRALQEAQRRAWGISNDGYIVPVATMVGAQLHGGLVLGAFTSTGEAVGLSFAFLGRIDGRLCLYSQLTGVVPEYQGHGLGLSLKLAQLDFARAHDLGLLAWAFDPLQAGNAHFNLGRLGATSRRYVENMYGPRTDALNVDAPTDRLIVEWATHVRLPTVAPAYVAQKLPHLIVNDKDGPRVDAAVMDAATTGVCLLEIPEAIAHLRSTDPATASLWQTTVRAAFTVAFAAGYTATGFHREIDDGRRRVFYVLDAGVPAGS